MTLLVTACGGDSRPPFAGDLGGGVETQSADAGGEARLIEDDNPAAGHCGETTVELDVQRPNFYFVLDTSESMLEVMPNSGGVTRHLAARQAVATMLRAVGHRVNFGAATFPEDGGCGVGSEVFPVRAGDPLSENQEDGPVLDGLLFTLSKRSPLGATPVSETLRELQPTLGDLAGKTSVFLLTDGAPNCDLEEPCGPSSCILNIEGTELPDGRVCDDSLNCCAPDLAPHLCLDDDDAQVALRALAETGISTYVIGIPGSEIYSQVLSAMAEAAGTARNHETAYYQVSDAEQLALTLSDLGRQLSLSCEFDLGEAPARPDLVHVVTGNKSLEFEAEDGWEWKNESVILLKGQVCESWKAGDIAKVEVFQGCPFTMK